MNELSRSNIWHLESGSPSIFIAFAVMLLVGIGLIFGLTKVPARARRPIVSGVTFFCGLLFVLYWLWPQAQGRGPLDKPMNPAEDIAFFLSDAVGEAGAIASIITAFLLGLGAFSLLRIHGTKLIKGQKDWFFSAALLFAMVAMMIAGYGSWYVEKFNGMTAPTIGSTTTAWSDGWFLAKDYLFDGLLQKMDGAMFSLIAFYIISAAYRAFRIRSVEATILLAAALIMMLSLLALVSKASNDWVDGVTGKDPNAFMNNFRFTEIAGFVRSAFQSPALRGIDMGIGIGALAMGIRLWLSLEKQGTS